MRTTSGLFLIAMAIALAASPAAQACATCFGASDDNLARGMNWGIFTLLAVVVGVLSGFATFFVYLGRRSAAVAAASRSATGSDRQETAAPGHQRIGS